MIKFFDFVVKNFFSLDMHGLKYNPIEVSKNNEKLGSYVNKLTKKFTYGSVDFSA